MFGGQGGRKRRTASALDTPVALGSIERSSPEYAARANAGQLLDAIEHSVPTHLQYGLRDAIEWLEDIYSNGLPAPTAVVAPPAPSTPPAGPAGSDLEGDDDAPPPMEMAHDLSLAGTVIVAGAKRKNEMGVPLNGAPAGYIIAPGQPTEAWTRRLGLMFASTDITAGFTLTEKHLRLAELHIQLALDAIPEPGTEELDIERMARDAKRLNENKEAARLIFMEALTHGTTQRSLEDPGSAKAARQVQPLRPGQFKRATFVPFVPTSHELEEIAALIKDDLCLDEADELDGTKEYLKRVPMARFENYVMMSGKYIGVVVMMLWGVAPHRVSLFMLDSHGKYVRHDLGEL